jgi:hypothetical protein
MTFDLARWLAAARISSNLKASTKQFGWLQAPATKKFFLSITSANPATIRIDNFDFQSGRRSKREIVSVLPVSAEPDSQ